MFVSVFCARADPPCVSTPCSGITKIADCPDEGCTRTQGHQFDQELDKRKNIRSDDQQPVLRSIRWIKGLEDPTNLIECGNRDELKQMGEGQKITVVAWALTAIPTQRQPRIKRTVRVSQRPVFNRLSAYGKELKRQCRARCSASNRAPGAAFTVQAPRSQL